MNNPCKEIYDEIMDKENKRKRQFIHHVIAALQEFTLHLSDEQKMVLNILNYGSDLNAFNIYSGNARIWSDPLDQLILYYLSRIDRVDGIASNSIDRFMIQKNRLIQEEFLIQTTRNIDGFFIGTVIKKIKDEIYTEYPINKNWINSATKGLALDAYENLCNLESNDARNAFLILGDALEDFGCTDKFLLDHCKEDIYHCKGCFLLEQLMDF